MTTSTHTEQRARAGDWIEVSGLPGRLPRCGQIALDVNRPPLGQPGN